MHDITKEINTEQNHLKYELRSFWHGEHAFSNLFLSLQLTEGGKAARAKMNIGDIILSINGISTEGMNHLEAQNKIKACTDQLSLTLQR